MPQNAIIRADGTGDYTSIIAWEAAEQSNDYGSVTVGRVDGFFNQGSSSLVFAGTWVNGARLEPFDSTDGFDGTERQLCGLTSSNANRAIRAAVTGVILDGLEVYYTGVDRCLQSNGNGFLTLNNGLAKTSSDEICDRMVVNNSVLVSTNTVSIRDPLTAINVYDNVSIFFESTMAVGQSSGTSVSNGVSINGAAGGDFDPSVTQSNNASTDTTADNLNNIVIADNFVSATPVSSGDYRIKAGSDLDVNGIGPFVQSSSGVTVTVDSGSYLYSGSSANLIRTRLIKALSGLYNYTGNSVSLLKGCRLIASPGSYTYLGQDVNLTYTPAGQFILTAKSGNYLHIGADINFNRDRVILMSSGTYNYDGTGIQIILPGQIWTDKASVSTNWNNQTNTTTIWTDK